MTNPANDNRQANLATVAGRSVRTCPNCGKPAAQTHRPFCSKRCADIDLHRWLGGVYAIPAAEAEERQELFPSDE